MAVKSQYREVLAALVETLFPVVDRTDSLNGVNCEGEAPVSLQTPVHLIPEVIDEVLKSISVLPPESRSSFFLVLELLRWSIGTLVLGGTAAVSLQAPFLQPFARLSLASRECILQSWAHSSIPKILEAFKGVKGVLMSTVFSYHDAKGRNPLWLDILYKGPDPERPAQLEESRAASENELRAATLDISKDYHGLAIFYTPLIEMLGECSIPEHGSEWDFVKDCDVVVVGSGAGGGVAAALLAQAGAKVIVVEKGTYTPAQALPLQERDAFGTMYEGGGLMTTDNAGINILAGATLGGGTRINWSASFATPDHVRKEWSEQHGLKVFTSEEYDRALAAVTERLGVTTGIKEHSRANSHLKAGLERLGVHCGEIPRNTSRGHACGHCSFGCASGEKRDTTATYLVDAVRSGAKILTGAYAERILMSATASASRPRQVSGVVIAASAPPGAKTGNTVGGGMGTPKRPVRLLLRCAHVVAACGALHTPALLLRSGVTVGGNVGANLRMHPATVVTATFPKDQGPVLGWEGAIMSVFSREAADWEGLGYGPMLATPSAHPGLTAASFPWPSGEQYRLKTLDFPYTAGALVYVRDQDSGCVYKGADGQPRVQYWPSARDRASMVKGMELGLRALVAAGAQSVMTLHSSCYFTFEPRRDQEGTLENSAAFEDYLQSVHTEGVRLNKMAVLTAHQMGSARMGTSRATSVADPNGHCWDVEGLYICDASALPTSTGVNPMVTVEAVAYVIASRLARKLSTPVHGARRFNEAA
ncbi:g6070 [Coccomyxa elongata]